MNMKLNALVLAAVAALSLSGAANAAYTNSASGDSSLFLTLLDDTNKISALFDLGKSYSSFQASAVTASGTSFAWNVATGDYADAWTTFLATASTSTSKFAVFAGDLSGTLPGEYGFISTYKSGTKASANNPVSTGAARVDAYLIANEKLGNHSTVANGASTAKGGDAYADTVAYVQDKVGQTGNIVAMGAFDTSLSFISAVRGAGSNLSPAVYSTYGNEYGPAQFTFTSAGLLTYTVGTAPVVVPPVSSVPEPESYAMMVAGLGLMGVMVRRRKNSK